MKLEEGDRVVHAPRLQQSVAEQVGLSVLGRALSVEGGTARRLGGARPRPWESDARQDREAQPQGHYSRVMRRHYGVATTAMGFEADPMAFEPFYTMGAEKSPLLPRPLTGGVSYDSLGSAIA